jgi:hypothetical protein
MERFMVNRLDEQYNNLLKDILENGVKKDRTRNGEVKVYLVTLFITICGWFSIANY